MKRKNWIFSSVYAMFWRFFLQVFIYIYINTRQSSRFSFYIRTLQNSTFTAYPCKNFIIFFLQMSTIFFFLYIQIDLKTLHSHWTFKVNKFGTRITPQTTYTTAYVFTIHRYGKIVFVFCFFRNYAIMRDVRTTQEDT